MNSCLFCGEKNPALFFEKKNFLYFRCEKCSFVFLHPEQRLSQDAEFRRYETHENDSVDYEMFLRKKWQPILQQLSPGGAGLDYGGGKQKWGEKIFGANAFALTTYDLFYFPETKAFERTYEFILCSETAEHFREPVQEFFRLYCLLKKGGRLFVGTEFVPTDFPAWHYHRDPTHISFYSPKTFTVLCDILQAKLIFCGASLAVLQKT